MNKFFLLSLSLFFISNLSAQEQEYVPLFGESETGWYHYQDADDLGGKIGITLYTEGDSTVEDHTYRKVYYNWAASNGDSLTNELAGMYREDIEERKVYSLNAGSALKREALVYDFSKAAGDTVKLGENIELLVDSVTNILNFCGQASESENRVFYLTDLSTGDSSVIWIEGVGSLSSFFFQDLGVTCDSITEVLVCKMTDDEIVFHYDQIEGFEECPFEVGSSNKTRPDKLEITLYPNPASDKIVITGNAQDLGRASYKVYSITGQEVKRGVLDYSYQSEIDVTHLNNGAYLIEIFNKEKNLLSTKKFIIAQ